MLLSEGQMSDYKGAALMLPAIPEAKDFNWSGTSRGGGCGPLAGGAEAR
jgi:hypothetical protein